jgi:hypothetical protein
VKKAMVASMSRTAIPTLSSLIGNADTLASRHLDPVRQWAEAT